MTKAELMEALLVERFGRPQNSPATSTDSPRSGGAGEARLEALATAIGAPLPWKAAGQRHLAEITSLAAVRRRPGNPQTPVEDSLPSVRQVGANRCQDKRGGA